MSGRGKDAPAAARKYFGGTANQGKGSVVEYRSRRPAPRMALKKEDKQQKTI